MRPVSFLGGALVVAAAASSHASVPRVLVVVVPVDEGSTSAALVTEASVTSMLAQDDRLQVVDPASRYAPDDAVGSQTKLAAARAALEEISGLLASVDYEPARAKAEQAIAALRGGDFRTVRDVYVQLLMNLARIKKALKVDDGGAAELDQALAIDPDASALRGLNGEEKKAFEAAKAAARAGPRAAAVTISSEQRGWLWVDGRPRGVTPVTVADLSLGRHFVTFVVPGASASVQSELFGAISSLVVSAPVTQEGRTYRGLVAALGAGMKKREELAQANALREWARVDEVIAVGVSSAALPNVLRVGAAGQARRVSKEASPAAIVTTIRELVDEPLRADVAAAVVVAPSATAPAVESAASGSKAPGWVMVAIGVGLGIAGAVCIGAGQGEYQRARMIPQPQEQAYASAVATGRALNYGGVGAVGAGLLVAGIGVAVVW